MLGFIMERLASFLVLIGIALLIVASLLLNTIVSAFYGSIHQVIQVPGLVARMGAVEAA